MVSLVQFLETCTMEYPRREREGEREGEKLISNQVNYFN